MNFVNNIGIIVAMDKELNLLLPLMTDSKTEVKDKVTFHIGNLNGKQVVVMKCGIGKVNAAISTVTMINNYNVNLIISSGVAGGADKSVNVMDVVFATEIAYHDVWCGPGTVYGEASGFPKYFCSNPEILKGIDFAHNNSYKKGLLCSGDKFISSIEEINVIKKNYPNVLAVDMESTSIAQVCNLYNVDFVCARVISDSPGANHDNSAQYDNFWEDAPKHTFAVIKEILNQI